jgi:metal-responsive CopG/Arc/MetJ family transcriptional regulator
MTADGKTRVQITLTDELLERLNMWCDTLGISKSAAASIALADWVQKVESQHGDSRK